MNRMRAAINRKNIGNVLFFAVLAVFLFNAGARALLIKGVMKLGLMRPPAESTAVPGAAALARSGGLTFLSSDQQLINTNQQKGKVLIINFWATWCPPCIAEMPSINAVYLHYRKQPGVEIMAVDADADFSKSLPFMKQHGYSLPVYKLVSGAPGQLMSGTIPTTLIMDKNGMVTARHEGAADYDVTAFYGYIDQLVKAP